MPTRYASPNSDSSNACDIGGKKSATRSACPSALPPPRGRGQFALGGFRSVQSGMATAPPSMCGSPPLTEARPWRTSYSHSRRPPDGLAGPWWRVPRRGHQRCQGAPAAAWAGCAAQGCGPSRVRHRGCMVGVSAGAITARPDRSAGRATMAPTRARLFKCQYCSAIVDQPAWHPNTHITKAANRRTNPDEPRGSRKIMSRYSGTLLNDGVDRGFFTTHARN